MEESFPRGGVRSNRLDAASAALRTPIVSSSSREEKSSANKRKAQQQHKAQLQQQATDKDFLFGNRSSSTPGEGGGGGGSKKKRRKLSPVDGSTSTSSSMLPLGGGAVLQPTAYDHTNKKDGHSKAALIESLSFNKLGKGTRLLGLVRDVAPDYVVVSLPNMLTGFVRRVKETDTPLTDVYNKNTMMAFTIVKTTAETVASTAEQRRKSATAAAAKPQTRRRIELTASPQIINADLRLPDLNEGNVVRGRIVSCEDHGCIVDLAVAGLGRKMAFLRYESVDGNYEIVAPTKVDDEEEEDTSMDGSDSDDESDSDDKSKDSDDEEMVDANGNDDDDKGKDDCSSASNGSTFFLNPGRVYDFTIKSVPAALRKSSTASSGIGSAAVLQLGLNKSSTRAKIATSVLNSASSSSYTVRTLQPGMLLKCHVEHYARNGLCVTFLGNVFRGSVDMVNLGGYWSGDGKMDGIKDPNLWWKDVFVGKNKTVSSNECVYTFSVCCFAV